MSIWPVGLRFEPTENELVDHHLRGKLKGKLEACCLIPELYIYNYEPSDLFIKYNESSEIPSDGRECFFFCPCGDKIPNNRRSNNRMTELGYWKDTCKNRVILSLDTGKQIGIRKILVYHEGRQPRGHKTDVVMHEYHLKSSVSDSKISSQMAFVLCHIIDRKLKKARSAKATTSTSSSAANTPNDYRNGQASEISAQASQEITIETENSNEILITSIPDSNWPIIPQQAQMQEEISMLYNGYLFAQDQNGIQISSMPDGNLPMIPQQAQMHEELSLLYNDYPFVNEHSNKWYDIPYSTSYGIEILDLENPGQTSMPNNLPSINI